MKIALTIPNPRSVTQSLVVIVCCLAAASLIGQTTKYFFGHDYVFGLIDLFDVNKERNIPTWYSSCALMGSAILLGVITFNKKSEGHPLTVHWAGLAVIFLFLSLDELVGFHERTIQPLRQALGASGGFYYTWVVPGMAVVFLVFMIYRPFLSNLPPKIRRLFLFSGMIFIAGALGMEMIGGYYVELYGKTFIYSVITTLEEVSEMLGIVFFIHALLTYIQDRYGDRILTPVQNQECFYESGLLQPLATWIT